MSTWCDHDGTVERITTTAPPPDPILCVGAAEMPEPRHLWQCTRCYATWPADPRQLAAQHDGLLEALLDGIPHDDDHDPEDPR